MEDSQALNPPVTKAVFCLDILVVFTLDFIEVLHVWPLRLYEFRHGNLYLGEILQLLGPQVFGDALQRRIKQLLFGYSWGVAAHDRIQTQNLICGGQS